MRDSKLLLSNAQDFASMDSTGEVTDNVLDLEQDGSSNVILTDDQVEGFMNVVVTSTSGIGGGTEGIVVEVHNGDNSDLTTSAKVLASLDIPYASLVDGAAFSVPFRKSNCDRYLGGWVMAKSTSLTGTLYLDIEFSDEPISENESIQKVPA